MLTAPSFDNLRPISPSKLGGVLCPGGINENSSVSLLCALALGSRGSVRAGSRTAGGDRTNSARRSGACRQSRWRKSHHRPLDAFAAASTNGSGPGCKHGSEWNVHHRSAGWDLRRLHLRERIGAGSREERCGGWREHAADCQLKTCRDASASGEPLRLIVLLQEDVIDHVAHIVTAVSAGAGGQDL
jgi:hypothetical protein